MAQGQNIFLGRMKKSIGNLTALTLKGKNIIKSKALEVKQPMSTAQVNWSHYFSTVVWFLKNAKSLVDIGFYSHLQNMPPFSRAMMYNLKLTPDIIGGLPYLDLHEAMVSRGSLEGFLDLTFWIDAPFDLKFSWTDNSSQGNALANDRLMLFICNSNRNKSNCVISETVRSDGSATFTLSGYDPGEIIYCFLFFSNSDGSISSDTLSTGQIEIPGE